MTKEEERLGKEVVRLSKELKMLKEQKQPMMSAQGVFDNAGFIRLFRPFARLQLRLRGYSRTQATRMVNKLGDGKILALIIKYGPMLLKIFLALLPLFMMMEPPEGQPVTELIEETDDPSLFDAVDEDHPSIATLQA